LKHISYCLVLQQQQQQLHGHVQWPCG
jgi:hypothetical protein